MVKRHYDEYMFCAIAISFIIIALFSQFELVSKWRVMVCSVSAATISFSQTFNLLSEYDKLLYETQLKCVEITEQKLKIKPYKERKVDMSAFLYVLAIVILLVGFSLNNLSFSDKTSDFITLTGFSLIFVGYWCNSYFSRKISELNDKISEAETLKRLEEI